MNKLRNIIMILFLVIIILIIIILISFKKNNMIDKNEGEISREESQSDEITDIEFENSNFSIVKNNAEYYSIKQIIDNLCQYIKIIYNENYLNRENGFYLEQELSEEDKKSYFNRINNMLSKKYTTKYNINDIQSLENYIDEIKKDKFTINKMYYASKSNSMCIYLIYGKINDQPYNFMLSVDLVNNSYEIYLNNYLNDNKYTEENIKNLNIEIESIEQNEYNNYTVRDISNEEMAKNYFENLKEIFKKDKKYLYSILDEEYKKEKFNNSYDLFEEYYNLKKNTVEGAIVSKYKTTTEDDNKRYYIIDNLNNYYVFCIKGVMDYTIILDDYTIQTEEFKNKYKLATDSEKATYNIEKLIKMINAKDYSSLYNNLNETFKKNNFGSIEKFKEYIQKNFFENNVLSDSINITKSGAYYVCTVKIKAGEDSSSDNIEKSFIISLGDETNFEWSFKIN